MIIGIYGYQDSGKTLFVEGLVGALVGKGYRVSSIKHTTHEKSVDLEGKDTWRHWKAGSDPVVFASRIETTLIKHSETAAEDLVRKIQREYAPDVLIVEGCKNGSFPKVAIGDVGLREGTILTNPNLSQLVEHIEAEVAVERVLGELPGLDCGKCGTDCRGLAVNVSKGVRKIGDCTELSDLEVSVFFGGKKIPTGKFVSRVLNETIRGMLGCLKGVEPGKDIEIRLGSIREALMPQSGVGK